MLVRDIKDVGVTGLAVRQPVWIVQHDDAAAGLVQSNEMSSHLSRLS